MTAVKNLQLKFNPAANKTTEQFLTNERPIAEAWQRVLEELLIQQTRTLARMVANKLKEDKFIFKIELPEGTSKYAGKAMLTFSGAIQVISKQPDIEQSIKATLEIYAKEARRENKKTDLREDELYTKPYSKALRQIRNNILQLEDDLNYNEQINSANDTIKEPGGSAEKWVIKHQTNLPAFDKSCWQRVFMYNLAAELAILARGIISEES